MLIDTHCHIHEPDYPLPIKEVLKRAEIAHVHTMICVGTSEKSSAEAVQFAGRFSHIHASVGVHPHETKDGYTRIAELATKVSVIAIGEIGLDYFYTHSPRDVQIRALKAQIEIALAHDLPIIFHVREAFEDFWPIFDSYENIRGVLHSFTDTKENLDKAVERGLYIGVNGISTFTKDELQQEMFDSIPLDRLLFETDAPFLTPKPFRGTINEPAFVRNVAEFHANRKDISLDDIEAISSANATALFALSYHGPHHEPNA